MIRTDHLTSTSGFSPLVEVNWLQSALPDPEQQREYAQERCIIAVTEALAEAIEATNISQAELARRLNVHPTRVTHILSERNLTLKTVGDVLWACGLEMSDIAVAKLGVSYVAPEEASDWGVEKELRVDTHVSATTGLLSDIGAGLITSGSATSVVLATDPSSVAPETAVATDKGAARLAA